MNKKKIIIILFSILIFVGLVIGLIVFNKKEDNFKFKDRLSTLNSFHTSAFKDGWIQVEGTNIDMPVIYNKDLLTKEDNYSYAWLGAYPNGDNYTRKTIGSHNVINVSNKPVTDMTNLRDFEGLMAFTYYSFAKKNLYIKYTDYENKEEYLYKIYAIGFYDYDSTSFNELVKDNKEAIDKYIKTVRENSVYKYDVDVNSDDELLMIFTCTRFFGAGEKQQIFIDARRVRENEKIEKYKVEKTGLFKELGLYN